jgi:hypothetical protein
MYQELCDIWKNVSIIIINVILEEQIKCRESAMVKSYNFENGEYGQVSEKMGCSNKSGLERRLKKEGTRSTNMASNCGEN